MEIPETRYARSGDVNIAYQVFGGGALDLVYVPGWVSHVEETWDDPEHAPVLRHLGSFARVIVFDKRGTGLSDRVPIERLPTLEERMDDVRAVMDTAGSRRARRRRRVSAWRATCGTRRARAQPRRSFSARSRSS
jgi:pimeloyl-ACP methyl ester carboxylesterase